MYTQWYPGKISKECPVAVHNTRSLCSHFYEESVGSRSTAIVHLRSIPGDSRLRGPLECDGVCFHGLLVGLFKGGTKGKLSILWFLHLHKHSIFATWLALGIQVPIVARHFIYFFHFVLKGVQAEQGHVPIWLWVKAHGTILGFLVHHPFQNQFQWGLGCSLGLRF